MKYKREFIGELIGTFLLVLFGCGSVAVSLLIDSNINLFQVALLWGIGATLAIYVSRYLSCAHLNPAVTLAMVTSKRMLARKMPIYILGQFMGAFLAGLVLFFLFWNSILNYETIHNIVRGSEASIQTAKIFGDFYNFPAKNIILSMPFAITVEAFGTFLLVLLVFSLTEGCNLGRPNDNLTPLFIGLTITMIICLIGPLTQAGLNPARDLGPRLVSWIFGWGNAAFPDNKGGFILVYILGPIIGGQLASLFFTKVVEPLMKKQTEICECNIMTKKGKD